MKYFRFLLINLVLLGCIPSAYAGLDEGKAAYNRGDYATAFKEFKFLADQGLAEGQWHLGFMYYKGKGVPQNYAEAVMWYRKAASQENAGAQNDIGVMYAKGQGVPKNNTEAMKWLRLAAAHGNADAQKNLRTMISATMAEPPRNQGDRNAQNNPGTASNSQAVSKNDFKLEYDKLSVEAAKYDPTCQKDCKINKYQYDKSCYSACMDSHMAYSRWLYLNVVKVMESVPPPSKGSGR